MRKKVAFFIAAILVVLSFVSCSGASGKTVGSVDIKGTEAENKEAGAEQKEDTENKDESEKESASESEKDGALSDADKHEIKDENLLNNNENKALEAEASGIVSGAEANAVNTASNAVNNGGEDAVQLNAGVNVSPNTALPDEEYKVFEGALFIGDSRTEGLSLYSGIKNADFFCAKSLSIDKVVSGKEVSVGGTNMSVYTLLESKEYSKVYISLGLNELGWTHIEKYIEEYTSLIDSVKESQPNAKIIVQALLPVSKAKSDKGGTVNNSQIYWYNINLEQMASDTGVTYMNAAAPLIEEDGTLLSDAATDGVHLKSEYCKIWAKKLAELSAE